jgi:hypothetical protein
MPVRQHDPALGLFGATGDPALDYFDADAYDADAYDAGQA